MQSSSDGVSEVRLKDHFQYVLMRTFLVPFVLPP